MKTNHKILTGLLAAFILLLFANTCFAIDTEVKDFSSTTFSDVTPSSWFYTGVRDAYQSGLMNGVGNNHFGPNSNFTVAQAIAVAARMYALYNDEIIDTTTSGKWYEPYIAYAADNGLLNDALKNTANPDTVNATRAQSAFLFYGVLSNAEKTPQYINNSTIPDLNQVPAGYANAVAKMFKLGIFTGMADGNFAGNADVTRAQISVIISRVLDASYRIPYDSNCNNELAGQEGNFFMEDSVIVYDDDYTYFVVANNDGSGKCDIVKRNNATMKAQIIYAGNGQISNLRLKNGCLYFIENLQTLEDMGGYTDWVPNYSYLIRLNLAQNTATTLYKCKEQYYIYTFELYNDDIYFNTQVENSYSDQILVLHSDGTTEQLIEYDNAFLSGRQLYIFNNKLYYVAAWYTDDYDMESYLMACNLNNGDFKVIAEDFYPNTVSIVNGVLYVAAANEVNGEPQSNQLFKMNLITDDDYETDKELVYNASLTDIGLFNYSVVNGTIYLSGANTSKIYKVLGDGSLAAVKNVGGRAMAMNFIVTGQGEIFYYSVLYYNFPFFYAPGYEYENGIVDYLGVGDFDTSNAIRSVATGK